MNERLGIAGCGAIGSGLARAAAPHGDVVVWARSDESAARAADATGVHVVTDIERLADCTMVVEAVAEDRMVKEATLSKLGNVLHPRNCPLRPCRMTIGAPQMWHLNSVITGFAFSPLIGRVYLHSFG